MSAKSERGSLPDRRLDAAAKAIEEALATKGWTLNAAAASVGIERKMSTREVVAHWLAVKALAAADRETGTPRDALRELLNSHWSHYCSDGVGMCVAVSWEKFCDAWDVLYPENPSSGIVSLVEADLGAGETGRTRASET